MYKKLVAGIVAYTFLLYSCITPNFVSLESPAPGAEFVVLNNEGIPLKTQRVLVAEVVPGSPAFESGICPEDPIIAINGEIPRTAAQAHAMLSDTTEVNLKIDSGGSEREVALVRKGIFGISFKNEFPIETTIKASGAETTLLVTHRDYLSFTDTISATKKIGGPKRQKFATAGQILLSFGLSFIAGSIILRPLAETTNYDNYPKTSTETDPGIIAISDFLMVLGPLGVIAGIPMLGYGHAKTYESKYTVPSRSLETHTIFDADGFNPKTGVDRYGITRNGVYPDGSRFDGKLVAGKREGYGSMISPDGKFAIMGTFKNDMLNGLAMEMRLTDPEHPLLAFFGYFLANKRSGVGIEFDENGKPATLLLSQGGIEQSRVPYPAHPVKDSADLLFLGPGFTNGKAEGRGLAILLNGKASQEGDFINGELKEGVKRSVDGSLQQGTFEKGFLVRGLIRNPDGSGGEGFWRNGSLQSPGRIIYANGNVYSGDFDAQGIPSGEGALVYANGDLYIGSFVHGIPEGRGTYSFKSGTSYTGELTNGTFQGKGKQVKPNGETFEGEFFAGLPHGMGIYKFGNMVERAEYYEGRRIDQAYIIREEREKDRIERVRIAEAAEQQRREQEEQQRIEAKRIAQKQRDEAEKANKAQQDKSLLAWGFAAATGLVGMDKGLDVLEATQLGISVYDDIVNDRGGSSVKQKSAEIIAARQANASSESKSRTDSGRFNELPGSSLNGDYKSGGNIVGTWKDGKGSTVTFGSRGEFRYKMTKSINNNPGQLEMIGTYSYDTTSQILTYTIMSTELSGSAGYDKAEPSNKTYSEKAIVLGSTLTFGGGSYTR